MILYRKHPQKAIPWLLSLLRAGKLLPPLRTFNRLVFRKDFPELSRTLFGVDFPGIVGISEGIDTKGEFYNSFADFGAAFVEIGPLKLRPEGRHDRGIRYTIAHLQQEKPSIPVAACLALNSDCTEEEKIRKDLDTAFSLLYDFVDFFIIETGRHAVSGGASSLEDISFLSEILDELLSIRLLNDQSKPILIRVSPALEKDRLNRILDYALLSGIEGILTSGIDSVKFICDYTAGRLCVIAQDEPMTPEKASAHLQAGASLLSVGAEIASAGPSLIRRIHEKNLT